jgi:hypothetical protein
MAEENKIYYFRQLMINRMKKINKNNSIKYINIIKKKINFVINNIILFKIRSILGINSIDYKLHQTRQISFYLKKRIDKLEKRSYREKC